jgi:hypothetical protein
MNSSSDPYLPADLLELKSQFETWRQTRKSRDPIPEDLRRAAQKMLDHYSASTICRACRLNPRTLKTVAPSDSPQATAQAKKEEAFFRLPPCSHSQQPANDCRLLLERPDGARLTLILHSFDSASLSSICTNFLRH